MRDAPLTPVEEGMYIWEIEKMYQKYGEQLSEEYNEMVRISNLSLFLDSIFDGCNNWP